MSVRQWSPYRAGLPLEQEVQAHAETPEHLPLITLHMCTQYAAVNNPPALILCHSQASDSPMGRDYLDQAQETPMNAAIHVTLVEDVRPGRQSCCQAWQSKL